MWAMILESYENKEWRIELRVEDNRYNVLLVPICAGICMYGRIEKQKFYALQKEKLAKATYNG
mgnify:CR=1 FL=1